MAKHTIALTLDKETPGTYKYAEVEKDGKPPVLKSLYVQKWAVKSQGNAPVAITVTIES